MIREAYWDLDGTVWKHPKGESKAIAKTLGLEYRSELEEEYQIMLQGIEQYLMKQQASLEKVGKYIETKMPILSWMQVSGIQFLSAWNESRLGKIIPAAAETVKTIYEMGVKNIAVTNWFWDVQINLLKDFEILQYFEQVHTIDGKFPKGHPERTKEIVKGKNAIVIGDSWTDIRFARNAGIEVIIYDQTGKKKFDEEPDYRVKEHIEILSIIQK